MDRRRRSRTRRRGTGTAGAAADRARDPVRRPSRGVGPTRPARGKRCVTVAAMRCSCAGSPARARPDSSPSSRVTSPSNGGTVLFGACREGGGPPFGPVVDALEHLLAHADDIGIDDADAERARSLLQAEPDEDAGPGLTFGQDPRAARFQAATDLLVDAGLRAPVLFVLDDLQWAGRPTLQLLLHWLRTAAPLRCCFVATHREARADIERRVRRCAGRDPPGRRCDARAGQRVRPRRRRRVRRSGCRVCRSARSEPRVVDVLAAADRRQPVPAR